MSTYLFLAAIATLTWSVGMTIVDARHARQLHRHQVAAQLRRVNDATAERVNPVRIGA